MCVLYRGVLQTKSGMRCWFAFARNVLGVKGPVFPPTQAGILAWSNVFRCKATFSNYLGYVRTGCLIVGVETDATRGEAVRRAKEAIAKRRHFVPRERLFVQRAILVKVRLVFLLPVSSHLFSCQVMRCAEKLHGECAAMLFLAAYIFMLRVPSEGFPMCRGCVGPTATTAQSSLYLEGE